MGRNRSGVKCGTSPQIVPRRSRRHEGHRRASEVIEAEAASPPASAADVNNDPQHGKNIYTLPAYSSTAALTAAAISE